VNQGSCSNSNFAETPRPAKFAHQKRQRQPNCHLKPVYLRPTQTKQLNIAQIPRNYGTFKPALLENKLKPQQRRILFFSILHIYFAKIQNDNMEGTNRKMISTIETEKRIGYQFITNSQRHKSTSFCSSQAF
jgi:hypothetical protein